MVTRERIKKTIQALRLLDDDFLVQVFDQNIEGLNLLLNIFLGRSDMEVIEVTAQREYKNVGGRSVRLDLFAKDSSGKVYDIEVQRADKGAVSRRARYYSSMLDTKLLNTGDDFSALVDSYVIFITEHDVMGEGLPLYHIRRIVEETGRAFGDGTHILYVNAAYEDNTSPIGKLMHDFRCTSADEMNYTQLAEKVRYFKETEGGQETMCRLIEELINEEKQESRREAVHETQIQNALNMIEAGRLTYEEIAEYSGLPLDEVKKLALGRTA